MSKPKAAKDRELEPGVWLYTDGSVRRANGTMVRKAGPMVGAPTIDKALSAEYNEKQKEMYATAAEQGMVRGAGMRNRAQAWSAIIAKRTEVAIQDPGHAGNQAAELVGRAVGAMGKQANEQEPEGMTLRMTPQAMREFRMLLGTMRGRGPDDAGPQVIEGETVEVQGSP